MSETDRANPDVNCPDPERTHHADGASEKPDYVPPAITSLTEADVLRALGPAHTGGYEDPFGTDGLGGSM